MIEPQYPPPENEKPKAPSTTSVVITEGIGWILFAIMLGGLGAVIGLPMLTD